MVSFDDFSGWMEVGESRCGVGARVVGVVGVPLLLWLRAGGGGGCLVVPRKEL